MHVEHLAGNEDAGGYIIALSIEISVVSPLMEECVAQTVRSLRELAIGSKG